MPRLRKREVKRRSELLRPRTLCRLTTGQDFDVFDLNDGYLDDAELQRAWEAARDELLAACVEQHPASRPWGWWRFEAPERRQRIDGKPHPFDNSARAAHVKEKKIQGDTCRLSFGVPPVRCVPDDWDAVYESERDYLDRLFLLTEHERDLLAVEGITA